MTHGRIFSGSWDVRTNGRRGADSPRRAPRAVAARAAGCVLAAAALLSGGCGARTLSISQDEVINTGMQQGRPIAERTGAPLELCVVCASASDLKESANDRLAVTSGITAREWYEKRPQPGDNADNPPAGRFKLSKDHILMLTNDGEGDIYGVKIGSALRGGKLDGSVKSVEIKCGGGLFDDGSVIYVFPRFTDENGQILPVPPAKFHPVNKYGNSLKIRVGADARSTNFGQYVEIVGS